MQSQGAELFSGGGFMPSQSNHFNEPSASLSAKKITNTSTGLLPLTVKQSSQASQKYPDDVSNYNLNCIEVYNVTLVGRIVSREERVTDISFYLDDGTGIQEMKRWINDAAEVSEMASVKDGTYVRVHGHLKSVQGKKLVTAFSVKPVTDYNEIAYHFLECINIHLYNVKSQEGSVVPNMSSPGFKIGSMAPPSGLPHAQQNSYTSPAFDRSGGSKDLFEKVRDIFDEPQHLVREQGVHIDEITRRLPGYSRQQIMDAITFLSNDGAIYSTIDDDHFKSTNG